MAWFCPVERASGSLIFYLVPAHPSLASHIPLSLSLYFSLSLSLLYIARSLSLLSMLLNHYDHPLCRLLIQYGALLNHYSALFFHYCAVLIKYGVVRFSSIIVLFSSNMVLIHYSALFYGALVYS